MPWNTWIGRPLFLALVPTATLVAAAGCSSSTPEAGPTPSSTGPGTLPTTTVVSTTTSPSSVTPSEVPTSDATTSTTLTESSTCHTDELTVTLGRSGVGAGTTYQPVVFTNASSRQCTLVGHPGISVLDSRGIQAGPAATRTGTSENRVTLEPGSAASSSVESSNPGFYPPESCGPTIDAVTIRIYPPDNTVPVELPITTQVCTNDVGQLRVEAVVPGQSGQ